MKKILFVLVVSGLVFGCNSENKVDIDKLWEYTREDCDSDGCISGDCENGYGIHMEFGNCSNIYEGETKDGKRHGKGTRIFREGPFKGSIYEGEWKERQPHGNGTFTFSQPGIYQFNYSYPKNSYEFPLFKLFHQFTPVGGAIIPSYPGFPRIRDGDKYVGEFQNGLFHGKGTYTDAYGGKYIGEYKYGHKNGQGTMTWTNEEEKYEEKYEGEWKNNKMHGQGTYTCSPSWRDPNGRIQTGIWENHRFISGYGANSSCFDFEGNEIDIQLSGFK
jgi:hypothetical protein